MIVQFRKAIAEDKVKKATQFESKTGLNVKLRSKYAELNKRFLDYKNQKCFDESTQEGRFYRAQVAIVQAEVQELSKQVQILQTQVEENSKKVHSIVQENCNLYKSIKFTEEDSISQICNKLNLQ